MEPWWQRKRLDRPGIKQDETDVEIWHKWLGQSPPSSQLQKEGMLLAAIDSSSEWINGRLMEELMGFLTGVGITFCTRAFF